MTLAGPRLARAVLPALLCLPAAAQTPAGTGDAEAVRATFEAYRQALMAGDGELAASLVDRETGEYYRQLKRLVLEGSEEEVRQRTFVDRFLVVAFRHQFGSDELAAMELADVIVRAMDLGWINSTAIEQLAVGPIRIEENGRMDGSEAVAAARTRASLEDPSLAGGMDELEYRFVNEDGQWKFRFSSFVSSIDGVMRNLAAQLGADEDDLIFTLVESLTGVEVLPEVWESHDR
ncbi:MAG: hypothetical protein OXI49_09165 [Acidobacteriota bacterium]|nr:hypothetical protein [Acidobacteriota bacterium]